MNLLMNALGGACCRKKAASMPLTQPKPQKTVYLEFSDKVYALNNQQDFERLCTAGTHFDPIIDYDEHVIGFFDEAGTEFESFAELAAAKTMVCSSKWIVQDGVNSKLPPSDGGLNDQKTLVRFATHHRAPVQAASPEGFFKRFAPERYFFVDESTGIIHVDPRAIFNLGRAESVIIPIHQKDLFGSPQSSPWGIDALTIIAGVLALGFIFSCGLVAGQSLIPVVETVDAVATTPTIGAALNQDDHNMLIFALCGQAWIILMRRKMSSWSRPLDLMMMAGQVAFFGHLLGPGVAVVLAVVLFHLSGTFHLADIPENEDVDNVPRKEESTQPLESPQVQNAFKRLNETLARAYTTASQQSVTKPTEKPEAPVFHAGMSIGPMLDTQSVVQ